MINNPYQTTPMMNNNYMPMQNPYADRMNFLQNYQQSLQQPVAGTQMSLANQQPISKSVSEMTQMEKQQLRVLAILDQSKVSWGDLANRRKKADITYLPSVA